MDHSSTTFTVSTLEWLERRVKYVPKLDNNTGGTPAGGLFRKYGVFAPIASLTMLVFGGKLVADWFAFLSIMDANFSYRLSRWQRSPYYSPAASVWNLQLFYLNIDIIYLVFCSLESFVVTLEIVRLFSSLRWQHVKFLKQRDGLPCKESFTTGYAADVVALIHTIVGELPIAVIWYLLQKGIGCSFIVYFRNVAVIWSLSLALVNSALKGIFLLFGFYGQRNVVNKVTIALRICTSGLLCTSIVVNSLALVLQTATSPVTSDASGTFVKTCLDFSLSNSVVSLTQQHSFKTTVVVNQTDSISQRPPSFINASQTFSLGFERSDVSNVIMPIVSLDSVFSNSKETILSPLVDCSWVPAQFFLGDHQQNVQAMVNCTSRFYFTFSPSDLTLYYDSTYRFITKDGACFVGTFYDTISRNSLTSIAIEDDSIFTTTIAVTSRGIDADVVISLLQLSSSFLYCPLSIAKQNVSLSLLTCTTSS